VHGCTCDTCGTEEHAYSPSLQLITTKITRKRFFTILNRPRPVRSGIQNRVILRKIFLIEGFLRFPISCSCPGSEAVGVDDSYPTEEGLMCCTAVCSGGMPGKDLGLRCMLATCLGAALALSIDGAMLRTAPAVQQCNSLPYPLAKVDSKRVLLNHQLCSTTSA
jgi:hypothetical protein